MKTITDTASLDAAMAALSGSAFVTVDTEFLRESTYWPILCLIQIANDDHVFLIDPLAKGIDLGSFWALMADERTLKVFHAARQDVEIFVHDGDVVPTPLFDTQVAAMVCGFGEQVSYEQLVSRLSDGTVDKASRFTDWQRRPLTEKQLEYAAGDVTHLRDVYRALAKQLDETGRAAWVAEEMAVLHERDTYVTHPDDAWQRIKARLRKPQEVAILQHVAAWREREAQANNVPRSRVLKDDALAELAQQAPRDVEALGRLRAIPRGWERSRQASGLLEAVNAALALDKDSLPRIPRPKAPPEGTGAAVDLLRVLLKQVSESQQVAPKLLANAADLETLAVERDKADIPALHGWRRDLFGSVALDLLAGKLAMRFTDNGVDVFPID